MASTLPGESSAHPADEAQALRDEIEQTREHLGDTVEQLAAKTDVKKQARAEAARLGERVRVAVTRARGQAMRTAAKARDARTQAKQKVAAAAQAGRATVQAGAAQAKETAPGQARHALDQGARTAREQRGPLAATVGALVAALAALIIWKRGKRS
jgi:cobalamin biosynthesis Mg chelatase CobN